MKYIQAIFNVTCDAATLQAAKDLLCALAGNAGFEAFEDDGATVTGYAQKELFSEDVLSETLRQFPIDGVEISYSIADAEDKNWNSAWEEHGFEPITIDGRCVVHDTMHLPDSIPDGAMEVTIDTKQAFGTGNHETTAMIISRLLATDLTGKSVLDCGCGTGILSIVAAKAGAKSVTGYDIDEWSVENTTHNCAINGTPNVRVVKGDASVIKGLDVKFNVVLAQHQPQHTADRYAGIQAGNDRRRHTDTQRILRFRRRYAGGQGRNPRSERDQAHRQERLVYVGVGKHESVNTLHPHLIIVDECLQIVTHLYKPFL